MDLVKTKRILNQIELYLLIKQKIKKSEENYNYLQDNTSELKNQRVRNEDNIEKIPIFKVNKGKDSYYFLTRKKAQEFIKAYKIEDIGKIEIEENDNNMLKELINKIKKDF